MKFKKVATLLIFSLIATISVFFGCTPKYQNFKIEINGESTINLSTREIGDLYTEATVQINIKNAPNDSCRNILTQVSKENIVTVTKLESTDKDVALFKIKALENISSYDPSCEVTFLSAEGNKSCKLKVNIIIPVTNISRNENYTPYVVAGDLDNSNQPRKYFIDTTSLITFSPSNTTQRDVIYSLVDETLIGRYDISLSENGAISIGKLLDENNVAVPSYIEVLAKSGSDQTKNFTFNVKVLRNISFEDFAISYRYDNESSEEITFTGYDSDEVDADNSHTIETLIKNGISLSSNLDTERNVNFSVKLFEQSGFNFDILDVNFDKTTLNNSIVEFNKIEGLTKNYKIYSVNVNNDVLTLKLGYKGLNDYVKVVEIPINVRENPISLVVNSNEFISTYDIFDYYDNQGNGEKFNVVVVKLGAYDRTFRVLISQEDFNLLDVRFNNQILDYETLTTFAFDSDTNFYIRAKNVKEKIDDDKMPKISFVSSTLFVDGQLDNDLLNSNVSKKLAKTIKLNLLPGVKELSFDGLFSDERNEYYLQSNGNEITVEYKINSGTDLVDLSSVVSLNILKGEELISNVRTGSGLSFVLTSKNLEGEVEFKLVSKNGVETKSKKIVIYNYYDENLEPFTLNLDSNNIKTTTETIDGEVVTNYYIGLIEGKNSANIKIENPQNATVFEASISSEDESIIKTTLLSKKDLTFNIYALKSSENKIKITITLKVYNDNGNVNTILLQDDVNLEFEINTYYPISGVSAVQNSVEVVDGMELDYDSRNKNINVLDVEKLIKISSTSLNNVKLSVEYIFPANFVEFKNFNNNYGQITNESYALKDKENSAFKQIIFFAEKNHKFIDGKFTFGLTIKIADLANSNEYYLVPINVTLKNKVEVDDIQILNQDGFVYLESSNNFGQILAKATSKVGEVTNGSLNYEIMGANNSIDVEANTGVVTIKSPGVTKVKINANSSRYDEYGEYSVYKYVYVVVADGTENFPYILTSNSAIIDGKFYTLKEDVVLNGQIKNVTNGGINGEFVYSEYSNLNNKNSIYNLIYNGTNSIFESEEINYKLENINIIINANEITISNDFGFIAKTNIGQIKNVNLILANITIKSNLGYNIGLMFNNNGEYGIIENSTISGNVILLCTQSKFGGLVCENFGTISGEYNFLNKNNNIYNIDLKIIDKGECDSIGGLVCENFGKIDGIKVKANIQSNAKLVGGIISKINTTNENYSNLYFTGSIKNDSNSSVVGTISAKVENANRFELITTNLIENVNNLSSVVSGQVVGGLFGETNNITLEFSYITSFINTDFDLKGQIVGGLIAISKGETKLNVVHSEVKLNGNVTGALIGTSENVSVDYAYTKSTGASGLINTVSENAKINKTYATNSYKLVNDRDNSSLLNSSDNYFANNYLLTLSDDNRNVFNNNNYFAISNGYNNGLPYLVYNINGVSKRLITVDVTSINANFKMSENSFENHKYGLDNNVVVINDNSGSYNKAVIFLNNNLEYNLADLINISVTPYDANTDLIKIISDNENIIKIENGKVKVLGLGNVTLTISSLTNIEVSAKIYINVIEKIKSFNVDYNNLDKLDNENYEFKISKNNNKLFGYNLEEKTENNGVSFIFTNTNNELLLNNNVVKDGENYVDDSLVVFTAREEYSEFVEIAPYYKLNFGGERINLIDSELKITNVKLSIITGATMISGNTTTVTITEKESATFEVYVKPENISGELSYEILDELSTNLELGGLTKVETSNGVNIYRVTINAISSNITKNEVGQIKIWHSSNKDLYLLINVIIKNSELKSVELNHYASKVTKYDDYNEIINKETTPSTDIVAGNLGVLNINLYPSYANITSVEVYSSVNDNNYILFNQIAYNADDNLVVVQNAGNVRNGIKLDVKKSKIVNGEFAFDGNLYVSTLLPKNIAENTIFTITVVCYSLGAEPIIQTIDLNAKALTSVVLTNLDGTDDFYIAKGGELTLNINKINLDEDSINSIVYDVTSKASGVEYSVSNNYLTVRCPILTPRNSVINITPKFTTYINNQRVEAKSETISIKVVDFVINEIDIEECVDGILNNNLGNSTILKARLNVNKFISFDSNNQKEVLEASNINLKIASLEDAISKNNFTWNILTRSNAGNIVYNNIKENGIYSNFNVRINEDGYYYIVGKNISTNTMALKVNISYVDGLVSLTNSSYSKEFITEFNLNVRTYSSLDNPIPITSKEEFLNMKAGEDYILLNDITLDAKFGGIKVDVKSFDGNNKIINIQNFVAESTSVTSLGLFNTVSENTIIKNVTVNILATQYYLNGEAKYGLNVNAQQLDALYFGVIAGTNNGVITNCKVINQNLKEVNNVNIYKNLTIYVNASEVNDVNVGGLVGVNNGFITNSSVGFTGNYITINSTSELGGLTAINNNKISASFVKNITIYNNAKSKLTAGFVAENTENASVITSFVEGIKLASEQQIVEGGIFANSYVGGFVTINSGKIKDCYSNIRISTNKRSAGFVYNNTNGYIETCYTASTSSNSSQSYRGFVGNNEENITLDNNGIKYCYFLGEFNENASEDEYLEHATQITDLTKPENLEGFIFDNSSSTIWVIEPNGQGGNGLPKLYDAEKQIVSERKLLSENVGNANLYEYIYINNIIGTINNPIIVSNTEELLTALTNKEFLYSYYYNNKIVNTNINYSYISIVKDIDLSKLIDANNNVINSQTEIQKLQDITFAGNLNGNGMSLYNVTITAKNNTNYTSFGLFKQIGVEYTYNSSGKLVNNKLDEDNCSTIKNLNMDINTLSATITKSVGTLSGEIINSKLYNINLTGSDVVVTGANMVGGLAGRISGNSFVKGVSSSLSVKATYDNRFGDYDYKNITTKNIYKNSFDEDSFVDNPLNERVNIAGGLFGVVDIYKLDVTSYIQKAGSYSYYISTNIDRTNNGNAVKSNIQFVKVLNNFTISGDIAGGLFGYVESGSNIYDARLVLNDDNQNIIGKYAVGGIAGKNKGYLSYLTVEHELNTQREIDAKDKNDYKVNHLFSNAENKAIYVGGLIGEIDGGELENAYAKLNIVSKNSMNVGLIVGLSKNAQVSYVYGVGYLEAQDEVRNNSNIVTVSGGYASLIGRIGEFNLNSKISNVVSVLRNENLTNKFTLTGLIGYNNDERTEILGRNEQTEIEGLETNVGKNLSVDSLRTYSYAEFVSGLGSQPFISNNHFTINREAGDIYYRLTYNINGAVKEVNTEDDLTNLSKGSFTLTRDIYLTKPWTPNNSFSGTITSNERPVEDRDKIGPDGEKLGMYYKIFNLNINEKSNNVLGNIGLFTSSNKATFKNFTIVVGSNFTRPELKDNDGNVIQTRKEYSNLGSENYGLYINRNIVSDNENLGALCGSSVDSTFDNITIKFVKGISTTLTDVGGLVGYSVNSSFTNVNIKNIIVTKSNNENTSGSFVGGLVGNASIDSEINNINIETRLNGELISKQIKGNNYIGGLFGRVQGSNSSNSKISNVTLKNIALNTESGENVFAGSLVGEARNLEIANILVDNLCKLNINSNSQDLSTFNVGGLIGYLENASIENVNAKVSAGNFVINVNTGDRTKFELNVGGLVGSSLNGQISNVITLPKVNVITKNTQFTTVGGLTGKNNNGNIKNSIVKTNIKLSGASTIVYVGGLAGYSQNIEVNDSIYLGNIKPFVDNINNVGALIGANNNKISITNAYAIEDVNLVAKRNEDYGTFIKYSSFINNLASYLPNDVVSKNKEDLMFDSDIEEVSGEIITYKKGSIYSPYEIDETKIVENNGKYVLSNDNDYTYFVLNKDILLDKTLENVKGIIIGNGKTITTNNTFVNRVEENAIISSLTIKLENKTVNILGNNFTKNINSILANQNYGAIYNALVVGNVVNEQSTSFDLASFAPVAITNSGLINIVTSKVYAIIIVDNENVNLQASGFVVRNYGSIQNSLSVGNIEINNQNYKNIESNNIDAVCGFTSVNNSILINCVSAVTLPYKNKDNNFIYAFNYNGELDGEQKIINCRVDAYANGNYYSDKVNNEQYTTTSNLYYNFGGVSSDIWTKQNIGVLFGYSYPLLSVYVNDDFIKQNVITTLNVNEKEYYQVNNFGVLQNVINSLQNNNEITEMNIYQVASFNADIYKVERSGSTNKYTIVEDFKGFKLTKSLNYKGNNFVISGVTINNQMVLNNKTTYGNYVGLFYFENNESSGVLKTNADINIENLGLKDINYSIYDNTENGYIYVGGIVAYSNGKVNISSCYVSGEIKTIEVKEEELNNNKEKNYNNLYVGGFAGYLFNAGESVTENGSTVIKTAVKIENSVSEVKINLTHLVVNYVYNDNADNSTASRIGHIAYVGGIVANAQNAEINSNISTGDIKCNSVQELNMGGIVGRLQQGKLMNNQTISKVLYTGAYLGYYKDANDELRYKVNAVAGTIDELNNTNKDNYTGNKYNKLLSLVNDSNFDESEVVLDGKINFNLEINNNAFTKNIDENVQTKLINDIKYTIITENDVDENREINIESDNNYIVDLTNNSSVTIKSSKDLQNVNLIFINNNVTTISERLFDKLTNCTIINLTIKTDSELNSSAVANEVTNCNFLNITAKDIYVNDIVENNESSNASILIEYAKNSYFDNVNVKYGRLFSNKTYLGAIIGKSENTTINNSSNSATITSVSIASLNSYTAGLVGLASNSNIFKSVNDGIVYFKNSSPSRVYTSGIANGSNTIISFSINNGNVKGVIGKASGQENLVAGISNGAKVLYSINKGDVTSINGSSVSYGVSSQDVFYSYNRGTIASTKNAYGLTGKNAYFSYSLGGGYSSNGDFIAISFNSTSNIFSIKEIVESKLVANGSSTTMLKESMNILQSGDYDIIGSIENYVEKGTETTVPIIKLIDEMWDSPLTVLTETIDGVEHKYYAISNPFELWYWSLKVCGTNDDLDVKLVNDINMNGITYSTPAKQFTKTFDGQNYRIVNLQISSNIGNTHWGLIGNNKGTIKNIYFQNPFIDESDNQLHLNAEMWFGIVAGQNSGTIENILVGSTDDNTFIKIQKTESGNGVEAARLRIGTITGENTGIVRSCEVLNFYNFSLWSYLEHKTSQSKDDNLRTIEIGGIVGKNNKTLERCTFIGVINSVLINEHSHKSSASGAFHFFDVASTAHTWAGLIVGNGSATNCFALQNNRKDGDSYTGSYFLNVLTQNLAGVREYGNVTLDFDNPFPSQQALLSGISNGGAGATAAFGLVALGSIVVKGSFAAGPIYGAIIAGLTAAYTGITEGLLKEQNKASIKQSINSRGTKDEDYIYQTYKNTNNNEVVYETNCYNTKSNYVSKFMPIEATDAFNNLKDEALKQLLLRVVDDNIDKQQVVNTGNIDDALIPISKDFLTISNKIIAPKDFENKYYIYNEKQLAYALISNENKDIVLMDNIDLTNHVWDIASDKVQKLNNQQFISNGFYIVYGSNANFITDLRNKFGDEVNDYCVDKVSSISSNLDYGKFDDIEINSTSLAYDEFEALFKQFGGRIDNSSGDKNTKYYVSSSEQLQLIADAMCGYTLYNKDNAKIHKNHKGINFKDKTIVLEKDLEIEDFSLDAYNYTIYQENEDENRLMFNAPSWYRTSGETMVSSDITYDYLEIKNSTSAFKAFQGTFDGNGKTITTNQALFAQNQGTIKNLTINYTSNEIKIYSGYGAIGVIVNMGSIDNVTIKCNNSLNVNISYNFADMISDVTIKGDNFDSATSINLISKVSISYGLFAGFNAGIINNCNLELNDRAELNINSYVNSMYGNAININTDTRTIKFNNVSREYKVYDNNNETNVKLQLTNNFYNLFGLIAGYNTGDITNINLDKISLTNNLTFGDKINSGENGIVDYDKNSIQNNLTNYVGLISGNNSLLLEGNKQLENINVTDCQISLNSSHSQVGKRLSVENFVGMISGYSNYGANNVIVLNANIFSKDNGENSTKLYSGSIYGGVCPGLYYSSRTIEEISGNSTITKSIKIYRSSNLTFTNCFANNLNFVGNSYELIITKAKSYNENLTETTKEKDIKYYRSEIKTKLDGKEEVFGYLWVNVESSVSEDGTSVEEQYFFEGETLFDTSKSHYGATNFNKETRISLDDNISNVKTIKLNIQNVYNENGTDLGKEIEYNHTFQLKLQLEIRDLSGKVVGTIEMVNGNSIYYGFILDSEKTFNDFISSYVLLKEDGSKYSGVTIADQVVTINGQEFISSVTYDDTPILTNDDDNYGFTIKATFSGLTKIFDAENGKAFSEVVGDEFDFAGKDETISFGDSETITKTNASFNYKNANGEDITFSNITLIFKKI